MKTIWAYKRDEFDLPALVFKYSYLKWDKMINELDQQYQSIFWLLFWNWMHLKGGERTNQSFLIEDESDSCCLNQGNINIISPSRKKSTLKRQHNSMRFATKSKRHSKLHFQSAGTIAAQKVCEGLMVYDLINYLEYADTFHI